MIPFLYLAKHAKIHHHLDEMDQRYRNMLLQIERKEILAYADDRAYEKLEKLKEELLSIRFTGPLP